MGVLRASEDAICIRSAAAARRGAAGPGPVAAAIAALVLGSAAPAAAQTFTCDAAPFTARSQSATNWCWAASVEMATSRFTTSPPSQCSQADRLRARLTLPFRDCCRTPMSPECNLLLPMGARMWPDGYTWSELPAASSTTPLSAGQSIPFEPPLFSSPPPGFSLKEQVCTKTRPVVFTWKECGGGYHMMVVKGINKDSAGEKWVRYVNPSPVGSGGSTYKVSYSKFAWGNTCTQSGSVIYMGQGKVFYEINKP